MNYQNKISSYHLSVLDEKFINMKTQEDNTHLMESYSLAKYGSKKEEKSKLPGCISCTYHQYYCPDICSAAGR